MQVRLSSGSLDGELILHPLSGPGIIMALEGRGRGGLLKINQPDAMGPENVVASGSRKRLGNYSLSFQRDIA
jgi:hypothetical protein